MAYMKIDETGSEIDKIKFVKYNNDYEYETEAKKYSLKVSNITQDNEQWISDSSAISTFDLNDDNKTLRMEWTPTDDVKFNAYTGVNKVEIHMETAESQDNTHYGSRVIASGSIIGITDESDELELN